jgi:cytochrome c oxidase subunit 4
VTAKEAAEDLGESIIPLSNIQAQWESMGEREQSVVHRQLEELQKRDWRSLSLDEKRAGVFLFLFLFFEDLIWFICLEWRISQMIC